MFNVSHFVSKFAGIFIFTCIIHPKISAIQRMLLKAVLDLACFITTNFFWVMKLTILSVTFPKFSKMTNSFGFHFKKYSEYYGNSS